MSKPIVENNEELAKRAFSFLLHLQSLDKIKPFPGEFIPENHRVTDIVTFYDGGEFGFGSTIYLVSKHSVTNKVKSRICFANGALGRKTVPYHELMSRGQGVQNIRKVLKYLSHRGSVLGEVVKIHSIGDSQAVSALFNPRLNIKLKIFLSFCLI